MPPQFQNNFNQPVNNPLPPPAPYKHSRLVLLTVIMILVGILGVRYFLWSSSVLPGTNDPIIKQKQTDQFFDWKTYRNEEYGIEFKYPPNDWDFRIGSSDPRINSLILMGFPPGSNEDISLYIHIDKLNSMNALELLQEKHAYKSMEKIKIGEKLITRWDEPGMYSGEGMSWEDQKTENVAFFELGPLENTKKKLEAYAIIESFKFIE